MTTATAALNMEIVQGFAFKVFGDLTAQQMGALTTVGDRLGLFTTLAESGPVTSSQFAVQAGVHERYAREWLAAMACHGYLTYEATTAEFELPREHAFVLAQPESPLYVGSVFPMSQAYWKHIDLLTEAFKHGGGIPQNEFGEHFWCGFERFTAASFNNFLVQEWIPAMPSVDAALRLGGTAADVGCGNGQALLTLARGYRNASLVGYDNYGPAIAAATVNARAAGLDDRVRYELRDVTQGIPATYDLITMFDVVHDAPHPVQLLSAVAGALKPDGHAQPARRRAAQYRASTEARCVRLLRQPELLHDTSIGSWGRRHRHVYGRGAAARGCNGGWLRQDRTSRFPQQPVQRFLHAQHLTTDMEFLHETFTLRHSTEHCCSPAHWLARDYAGSSRDSRRRGQLRRAVGKRSHTLERYRGEHTN